MAEQQEIIDSVSAQVNPDQKVDMEVEATAPKAETGDETVEKREREETEEEEDAGESKKQKVGEDEKSNGSGPVKLGPKEFVTSVAMFDYFVKFMHFWPTELDVNKYEHMVLLDLIKKGHSEPEKKIGGGIKAFQVRTHPMWKSRCFFLVREDESSDDFSFRKCVDQILPLPENMKTPGASGNGGGRGGGGGRRGGRGGGRGGRFRR
ncbi:Protein EMBRYO DEFECTIVE [Cardamine amara subsp. amara]|uniref:Protein EMBRYO DEFECTIVE n=1 Tax=Cardamine amara subsp. amara TaxID=228776 RepID=A0ABD1AAQ9_CARAN